MFSAHYFSRFTLIIILCFYLFFPSGLSTAEGWYYAASIKYGGEIFHQHHLLYNALGLVFSWLPSKAGFEIISCMKIMNAFFAFAALCVIQQILNYLKLNEKHIVTITCLSGFSFSVLRYATENETYIVPLFFALLASFNYIKYITVERDRYAFNAGLSAAISVLFHQIYIFWWLGLLIGFLIEKRKKPVLLYIIISLIVPVVYMIVILIYKGDLKWKEISDFILGDFKENVRLELTWKGIFLSGVNLVRSFIQIHGYIFNMVRKNMFILIPGFISLIIFILAFRKFPVRRKTNISERFTSIHVFIIVLQFIFAMFSSGNAKFMMMIPVLVFLLVPFFALEYEKFLIRIMIAIVIWNISYGLIPLHYKSQAPEQFLCDAALKQRDVIIIASDDQLIKSMLYYESGNKDLNTIYKSPAILELTKTHTDILKAVIDSALNKSMEVLTNCLDEPVISRSSFMEGSGNKDFFCQYETILLKSWKMNTGTRSIYRVDRKFH